MTDVWNEIPLVDWVLMENRDETGKDFWKLVCLMHFLVKSYDGILGHKDGVEYVTGGNWYEIDTLRDTLHIAPNAYIVAKKAQELIEM